MISSVLKRCVRPLFIGAFPRAYHRRAKHRAEMNYWRSRLEAENGILKNSHYEPLFTTIYSLTRDDYKIKRIIDIGCGPRGSLEWATMAAERVGLDPLAKHYLELGTSRHIMKYVAAPSERIPFRDGYFDIVTCLNALDHVDNLNDTIAEIKRITRKGGLFLLSVEIDHPARIMEPQAISEQDIEKFSPEFETTSSFKVGTPDDHDLHRAVQARQPPYEIGKPGIYVAKMRRN